jgi:hypothetical protein
MDLTYNSIWKNQKKSFCKLLFFALNFQIDMECTTFVVVYMA